MLNKTASNEHGFVSTMDSRLRGNDERVRKFAFASARECNRARICSVNARLSRSW